MTDEGFAGGAYQKGTAQVQEGIEVVEDLKVMGKGFAEADAGVEDDGLGGDAMSQGKVATFRQKGLDLPRRSS